MIFTNTHSKIVYCWEVGGREGGEREEGRARKGGQGREGKEGRARKGGQGREGKEGRARKGGQGREGKKVMDKVKGRKGGQGEREEGRREGGCFHTL